jgi:uncharacterized coiled-coil DUF342 family protein
MNENRRDAYVQQLKAKMDEWNAEIDKLKAKADQAKAGSKIEYQKQMEDLREKRNKFQNRITEIEQAGEGAWEDLKQGVESSWEALKLSLSKAKSRFK